MECFVDDCFKYVKDVMNINQLPAVVIYPLNSKWISAGYQLKKKYSKLGLADDLNVFLTDIGTSIDMKGMELYLENRLDDNESPIIFYYNQTDTLFKLFMNSVTNIKKFHKNIAFAKY